LNEFSMNVFDSGGVNIPPPSDDPPVSTDGDVKNDAWKGVRQLVRKSSRKQVAGVWETL
jgi:hypothetical protein